MKIPPLISFELAKSHLRMTSDDLDREIETKTRLVSAIAVNHCKMTAIPDSWIVDSSELDSDSLDLVLFTDPPDPLHYIRVPGDLQAAVLLMLSDLFYNGDASTSDLLSDTVINLLTPFRDPTMA